MTCADFSYSETGRRGIGVNQPQSGLHYPFVMPDESVRHLIADFYLAYETNAESNHPLKISWLYGFGCSPASRPAGAPTETHAADILITDSAGNVVFDSTAATSFDTWGWGARHPAGTPNATYDYQIYQWLSETHVCRVVAYNTWVAPENVGADEDVAKNYPIHIVPASGVLDERSIYKMPKRTTSIKVSNGATISDKLIGVLDFEYGYNTTLIAEPRQRRGVRATNAITLNVEPGTGRGKYFDCPDDTDTFLYSINGLTGPNILLSALDCLWTTVPTTVMQTGETTTLTPTKVSGSENATNILLASNCPACCGCNDYVQVGNYMNRTADRYRPVGYAVSTIVEEHTANIARWLDQTNCRLQRPLQLDVTQQRCPLLDIVAQFCNQCSECATNVKLKIKVETFKFDSGGGSITCEDNTGEPVICNLASVECGRTNITTPYEGTRLETIVPSIEGNAQVFTATLGKVDIGNSGKVDFRLRFALAEPTAIQLTLTATTNPDADDPTTETPIRANCGEGDILLVVLNTALRCAEDGTTDLNC